MGIKWINQEWVYYSMASRMAITRFAIYLGYNLTGDWVLLISC